MWACGEVFELQSSEPVTSESASSLWPTPNVPNGGRTTSTSNYGPNGEKRQIELGAVAAMWPTMTNSGSGNRDTKESRHYGHGPTLNDAANLWATPQTHDSAGGDPSRVGRFGTAAGGRNLADDVTLWCTPSAQDTGRMWNPETIKRRKEEGKFVQAQGGLNYQACKTFSPSPPDPPTRAGPESSPHAPTSRRRLTAALTRALLNGS
jgi:hypothetical protein